MNILSGIYDRFSSWVGLSNKPTKRRQSTRSSPKKRKTDTGSMPVPCNTSQIPSIDPIRMDPISSMLANAYEQVFYEYTSVGNKLDEPKLRKITEGIYQLPDNSINSVLELFNQIIDIHDLLIENNYVKPVISLIAVMSTLKMFNIYEKPIRTPHNLTISDYCAFIDAVILLRKNHTTYANSLQSFQDDLDSKKNALLPYIDGFKKMITSKLTYNSIAGVSDSSSYDLLIFRLGRIIDNEKMKNDKLKSSNESESLIRFILENLNDNDLELIKKMKTSIKCKDVNNSDNELNKLIEFLESIDTILKKNMKSATDCYESVDKKYCRRIYDIIEKMVDPIVKENKKSNDEIIKEKKKIEGYKNELNRLYLTMGNEKPLKVRELEGKKSDSEQIIEKNDRTKFDTKMKLNEIYLNFSQYEEMLKSISSTNKTTLRRKLDGLKGVEFYKEEYEKLVKLLL